MSGFLHAPGIQPGIAGRGDPQLRDGAPQNEARRQAGTPTTREGSIDKAIDGNQDIGNRTRPQSYPVRWLASQYGLSNTFAAVIAAELGIGGGV
jgi:hypothetical protein